MNYKFVVARYAEDIDWIKSHDHILLNSIIYNKGDKIDGFDQVVGLQNYPSYTREADSYLTYIIENYYKLPNYLFFIQGNPFEHSPNFIQITNYIILNNIYKPYQPLSFLWKKDECIPPKNNIMYNTLNNVDSYNIYMEVCDTSLLPIGFIDSGIQQCLYNFRINYNISDPKETLFFLYNKLNIKRPYVGYLYFNYGAIFGVSRDNIHQNSYDFYVALKSFLYEHWANGYVIERLWFTMLG